MAGLVRTMIVAIMTLALTATGGRADAPTTGLSFLGVNSGDAGAGDPPDADIATGTDNIVEVTRGIMRVFRKTPLGEVVANVNLGALLGCGAVESPRVRFDPAVSRWYVIAAQRVPEGKMCFAYSATSDPTASFTRLTIALLPSVVPAMTSLAFSDDKVAFAADRLLAPGGVPTGASIGQGIWVFDKTDLLNGGNVASQLISMDPLAPKLTLATSLSSGPTLYMAGFAGNLARIWRLDGSPGVGTGVTITNQDFPVAFNAAVPNVPQKGSIDVVTVHAAVQSAVIRDNALWIAGTSSCTPPGDSQVRSCLRVIEFSRQPNGTFNIGQDITAAHTGEYLFLPAITVDLSAGLAVGYGSSSATTYPGFWVTGRRANDAAGTLRPAHVIAAGQAPFSNYDASAENFIWGSYFGAAADPADGHVSWLVGAYSTDFAFPVQSPRTYATRIQQVNDALLPN